MVILGLNYGEFNSSAAIYKNGKIVAGCAEERFNRQQKTKAFPFKSAKYCLDYLKIPLNKCDFIAQAWNPGANWQKYNPLISSFRIKREDYFYSVPDNLYNLTSRTPGEWAAMSFPKESGLPTIYFIYHHRTHAAASFFLSPFKEAAILTCDARGESECTTFAFGHRNKIQMLNFQNIPNSLGAFYQTYTELLGYKPDNDEWKVMALSAFDSHYKAIYKKIRKTVKLTPDGLFELDHSYYKGFVLEQPHFYTQKLVKLLGGRIGISGERPDKWHYSVAKAMQLVSEEIALHMLKKLYAMTKCKSLVLGGGYFMNSVFNGKVINRSPFKNLYIPYATADLGNSAGAALYVAHCIKNQKRVYSFNSSCLGPSFTDKEIETALKRRKIKYEIVKNYESKVAELIADGEIVAVMNGRMEFGERALGNRSILADPRKSSIKDKVNSLIKYRESYRPFAPAVLKEKANIYFDVPKDYECYYMEKVAPVRLEFRNKLPAITHSDGSARLQTVDRKENPVFHRIITEFEKIANYPVVLNTSFNINKEPIVLSPDDALTTFFNSGLVYLFIGKFFIKKAV